ncbi:hypothetical protein [Streptomyces sp. RFCAC02]|uniref:hypothetical protein n=1 Tax=Streptomyces sp. RFCAC02 TaxID=2499143 RepID=UPI0010208369|nr:hypothetical protein [Streptomyces sp. RFCAC02]
MPNGRYRLHDPEERVPPADEHFQCAPGPTGWRYVSRTVPLGDRDTPDASGGTVDLTLDALGRPVRLELTAPPWRVRGAALGGLTWVRMGTDGSDPTESTAQARAFAGRSPAFLVATARLLRLHPGAPTARVRLVTFAPPHLAPRTHDQGWTLLGTDGHPTDSGDLTVEHYRVDDLETGERYTAHLAGDVVLAAPGIELEDLDGPPSRGGPFSPAE